MKVREIMTSGVIGVPEDSTVEDAARTLARHRMRGLPVVNAAGGLVGLVTEYDLISKQGHSVAEIISRGVISVTEDTDVEEVSHLLANRRIRRVPVLRGDRLVGIVKPIGPGEADCHALGLPGLWRGAARPRAARAVPALPCEGCVYAPDDEPRHVMVVSAFTPSPPAPSPP